MIIRFELFKPGILIGDGQLYNSIITSHALLIIFFYSNAKNDWRFWELDITFNIGVF